MQEEKLFQFFCPNPKCSYYNKVVSAVKLGTYTTKNGRFSQV